MADKKISDLSLSTGTLGTDQYIELLDAAEALPADQNKKRSFSSLKTEFGTHTQGTDTTLDAGGANEVAASTIVAAIARSGYVPFTFTYNSSVVPTGIASGELRLNSHTPSSVTHVFLYKTDNFRDISDVVESLQVNSFINIQGRTKTNVSGLYKITAVTDSTTYMDYTVTVSDANGTDISGTTGEVTSISFIPKSVSGDVATDPIFDNAGDLAVGTGADTAAKLTAGANGQFPYYDSTQSTGMNKAYLPVSIGIQIGAEATDLAVGTGVQTFRMPFAMTLTSIVMGVTTAPTGSTLIVDCNESAVSILSTKLSIDSGETTSRTAATPVVISDAALAEDSILTFDIDQVGSTTTGQEITVWLIGTKNSI